MYSEQGILTDAMHIQLLIIFVFIVILKMMVLVMLNDVILCPLVLWSQDYVTFVV
jgi:hypothetical protein